MIYQKIINIMEELVPKGKIKREEIITVMQPLLAKYKLVVKPLEILDYKYMNQEASFKAKYEIVDAEDSELKSILIEIAAGGSDQDKKGRATYMASTGAYRQALQQLFVIQIEDDFTQSNNNESTQNDNEGDEFSSFHEFQDTEQNDISAVNMPNITNEQTTPNINMDEITSSDIDREFANF